MPPFPVIVADCPWPFADKLGARGAEANYRTLSIEELCRLELPPIADDAILFQWRVASMVPEAIAVTRAWGFEPKSEMVWHKVKPTGGRHVGMGRYVRLEHEVAWGSVDGVRSLILAPARKRRKCPCCGKRATHYGTGNGVALMSGCEWAVRTWIRDPRAHGRLLRSRGVIR